MPVIARCEGHSHLLHHADHAILLQHGRGRRRSDADGHDGALPGREDGDEFGDSEHAEVGDADGEGARAVKLYSSGLSLPSIARGTRSFQDM